MSPFLWEKLVKEGTRKEDKEAMEKLVKGKQARKRVMERMEGEYVAKEIKTGKDWLLESENG